MATNKSNMFLETKTIMMIACILLLSSIMTGDIVLAAPSFPTIGSSTPTMTVTLPTPTPTPTPSISYIAIDASGGTTCTKDFPGCSYLTMGACYQVPTELINRNVTSTFIPVMPYNLQSVRIASFASTTNTLIVNTYTSPDCSIQSLSMIFPIANALNTCKTLNSSNGTTLPVSVLMKGSTTIPQGCTMIPTDLSQVPPETINFLYAKLYSSY